MKSIFSILLLQLICIATAQAGSLSFCTPFKVHNHVHLPEKPSNEVSSSENSRAKILQNISSIPIFSNFSKVFATWLQDHPNEMTEKEIDQWLACLSYYSKFDTDQDGIPDWNLIVDRQPAQVLFPLDPDQDGDGVENIWDEDPLNANIRTVTKAGEIPKHLAFDESVRPLASVYQKKLYQDYGLLALDHTDLQSGEVLKEFYQFLQFSFSKDFVQSLTNFRYLYAFASHEKSRNVASYHWQARALSFGGESSYAKRPLTEAEKIELDFTLAHEIGHAVLFQHLTPRELAGKAHDLAHWKVVEENELQDGFFSKVFFNSFSAPVSGNMVSDYAQKNRHEWFAETFASYVLKRAAEAGHLGLAWRSYFQFRQLAGKSWNHWDQLSTDCQKWLEGLMGPRLPASLRSIKNLKKTL